MLKLKIRGKVLSVETKKKCDADKFRLDLSSQDCSNLYQCVEGNRIYNIFINVFSNTVNCTPHLKKVFNQKKIAEKPWLTKELREEITDKQTFLYLEKNPSEQAYTSFKYQRNLVNRGLKKAQNEFCKPFLMNYQQVKNKNNNVSSIVWQRKKLAKKESVSLETN